MTKSFFLRTLLALALTMALASHAHALTPMVMYATDTANKLYQVDMTDGTCYLVGAIAATSPPNCPQPDLIVGMVYKGGLLLALDSSGRLYQLKTTAPGTANFMRDTGIKSANNCTPYAFTIFHGSLADYYYAVAARPGTGGTDLFQVNPYGASNDLGTDTLGGETLISIAAYNGTLYSAGFSQSWYDVPTDGSLVNVRSLDGGTWIALTTSWSGPTLYGLARTDRKTIAKVNPANGHQTIDPSVTASVPLFVICSSYD